MHDGLEPKNDIDQRAQAFREDQGPNAFPADMRHLQSTTRRTNAFLRNRSSEYQ